MTALERAELRSRLYNHKHEAKLIVELLGVDQVTLEKHRQSLVESLIDWSLNPREYKQLKHIMRMTGAQLRADLDSQAATNSEA